MLEYQRNFSSHTLRSYDHDIHEFITFLKTKSLTVVEFKYTASRNYVETLYERRLKNSTLSRSNSTLRSYYHYLVDRKKLDSNPFVNLPFPKKESRLPVFLYDNEINALFDSLDKNHPMY